MTLQDKTRRTAIDGPRAFDRLSVIINRSQRAGDACTGSWVHSVTIYRRAQQ